MADIIKFHVAGNPEGRLGAIVTLAAKEHQPEKPIDGSVSLVIDFLFRRPAAHYQDKGNGELRPNSPIWHTADPPLSELVEYVVASLIRLRFWHDRYQIAYIWATKQWCVVPGVTVQICFGAELIPPPQGDDNAAALV